MDKKKAIAKAACKSSRKKDGKGGIVGDKLKAVAGAVSDKVKTVGDMHVKDAVTGIAKAATLPHRVIGGAVAGGVKGAFTGAKRGVENALGRGQGKKIGILKKQMQQMPRMLPKSPVRPSLPNIPKKPKLIGDPLPTMEKLRPTVTPKKLQDRMPLRPVAVPRKPAI